MILNGVVMGKIRFKLRGVKGGQFRDGVTSVVPILAVKPVRLV